jgi:hypothetical protein
MTAQRRYLAVKARKPMATVTFDNPITSTLTWVQKASFSLPTWMAHPTGSGEPILTLYPGGTGYKPGGGNDDPLAFMAAHDGGGDAEYDLTESGGVITSVTVPQSAGGGSSSANFFWLDVANATTFVYDTVTFYAVPMIYLSIFSGTCGGTWPRDGMTVTPAGSGGFSTGYTLLPPTVTYGGIIDSFHFEWGDGASDDEAPVETTPYTTFSKSHLYATTGNTKGWIQGRAPNGLTDRYYSTIRPIAAFDFEVLEYDISVDATASGDIDGSIASYRWRFGGSFLYAARGEDAYSPYRTGITETITVKKAREWDIELQVTDNDGYTNSLTQRVTVPAPICIEADAHGRHFASKTIINESEPLNQANPGTPSLMKCGASSLAIAYDTISGYPATAGDCHDLYFNTEGKLHYLRGYEDGVSYTGNYTLWSSPDCGVTFEGGDIVWAENYKNARIAPLSMGGHISCAVLIDSEPPEIYFVRTFDSTGDNWSDPVLVGTLPIGTLNQVCGLWQESRAGSSEIYIVHGDGQRWKSLDLGASWQEIT